MKNPKVVNHRINSYIGDTVNIPVRLVDVKGSPLDSSNASLTFIAKDKQGLLLFASPLQSRFAGEGAFDVVLSPEMTTFSGPKNIYWHIVAEDETGVYTVAKGLVALSKVI